MKLNNSINNELIITIIRRNKNNELSFTILYYFNKIVITKEVDKEIEKNISLKKVQ